MDKKNGKIIQQLEKLMRRIFTTYILMVIPITAIAQNAELQNSIKDISAELGSINQKIAEAYQIQQGRVQQPSDYRQARSTVSSSIKSNSKKTQDIYQVIIKKMYDLEKKYENNPYVRISGFDINIGIPPSVTISLEFKKTSSQASNFNKVSPLD